MSYSGPIRIAERAGFTVDSYGNGAAYVFRHEPSAQSVWLAGDDATQFREEWEALDALADMTPAGRADPLAWLWDQCGYSMAAQPDSEAAA